MKPFAYLRTAAMALGLISLLCAVPAQATLGQRLDSVRADRAHMAARMVSASAATHTVHTLTLPNGGVVHEYTDAEGVVFAVSWRGPGRPDLQQLLGVNFATLQADNVRADGRRTHRPLAVRRNDLVVQSGGHPGAFWGAAYVPQAIPAGFSSKDMH